MINVVYTNRFKKDLKLAQKRGFNDVKLKNIITLLCESKERPTPCRPHLLSGEWSDCWECHIGPDWILIYRFIEDDVHLLRTGTHSDLF